VPAIWRSLAAARSGGEPASSARSRMGNRHSISEGSQERAPHERQACGPVDRGVGAKTCHALVSQHLGLSRDAIQFSRLPLRRLAMSLERQRHLQASPSDGAQCHVGRDQPRLIFGELDRAADFTRLRSFAGYIVPISHRERPIG
jgi:hypothetical protein